MEVLEGQEPVIRTGEVHQYPAYVGGWAKVPPRTVAAIPAIANLHLSEERHFSVLIH